tara:strand:- start:1214 stop:1474 length:261 start_codon:yes stop_codon:yes gene_type:complete
MKTFYVYARQEKAGFFKIISESEEKANEEAQWRLWVQEEPHCQSVTLVDSLSEIEFEKQKSDFEYKKKKSIEGLTKEERFNLWQRE